MKQYQKKRKEVLTMPLNYSPNYEIIWLAQTYCKAKNQVSVNEIMRDVCRVFDITEKDLKSRYRPQEIYIPRQIGIYVARKVTGLPLEEIGRKFNRHHTSIMFCIASAQNYLKIQDPTFINYWNRYVTESRVYPLN